MAAIAAATASFTISKLLHSQKLTSSVSHTTFPAKPFSTFSSSFSLKLTSQFPPKPLKSIKSTADETSTTVATVSTVAVGDSLPDPLFSFIHPSGDVELVPLSNLTENKKVILFAVPGAFTPTCSQKHLPGFAKLAKELKAKGIHHIACISVNDAYVMKHWKQDLKLNDDIMMLSDGCGEFTRAIGCELDLSDKPEGLGIRSRRYSMLVENNVVKVLNLEEGGAFTSSGAEDMLKLL